MDDPLCNVFCLLIIKMAAIQNINIASDSSVKSILWRLNGCTLRVFFFLLFFGVFLLLHKN